MNLLRSLILVTFGSLAVAQVKNHVCVPSGYDRICVLENVYYELNGTVSHLFPDDLRHVRIGSIGSWQDRHSRMPHVDSGLYLMLGRPPVLELMNVGIETLEIPRSLRHGNFADNSIRKSWISKGNETEPAQLVYLDLYQNWMRELPAGIESLVNLEVLNLGSNSIETIPRNTLTKLTKLWYVNLCYNNLHRFSTEAFPTSVTHLELYLNNLDRLEYAELHFPAMEVLNLERNQLRKIDVPALLQAMPRLKTVRMGGNYFDEDDFRTAVEVLRSQNVSYRSDADDEDCYFHENNVEGVCLQAISRKPMGIVQGVVFTVMVLVVGVVFVLVTRWILREMNK